MRCLGETLAAYRRFAHRCMSAGSHLASETQRIVGSQKAETRSEDLYPLRRLTTMPAATMARPIVSRAATVAKA